MSESEDDQTIELNYDNWCLWDRHIMATIRRKNAYLAFRPKPVDPHPQQQAVSPAITTPAPTPSVTVTPRPTSEELKTYREKLKGWRTADNIAAGVILGAISDELQYAVNPGEPAKVMYDKLKAEVVKQLSGSRAYGIRIELVNKRFKDIPTMENFDRHLTFYRSQNAVLTLVGAELDDSLLAFLLVNSFHSNGDPIWTMACTKIITSDTPINQWSFEHVAWELREALCWHNFRTRKAPTPGTSQTSINATANTTKSSRYNGPPCTYPNCRRPKSHATDDCWTKKKEKGERKKHKAKKAKKRIVESSSEVETSSDSESDSEPSSKTRHYAHRPHVNSRRTLRLLSWPRLTVRAEVTEEARRL